MAWFSEEELYELAGPRSYQRGSGYLDAVTSIDEMPDGVVAKVHGTGTYQVRLVDDDGRLHGYCDCPYGIEGNFCKHCVAVGLTLLAEDELAEDELAGDKPAGDKPAGDKPATADWPPAPEGPPGAGGPAPLRVVTSTSARDTGGGGDIDLRAYLASLDAAALAELLYERAHDDPVLYRKLMLRAASSHEQGPDMLALRRQVDAALRPRGVVHYLGARDYADKAADSLATLSELVESGHAASVRPLARRVVEHVAAAAEQVEDVDGAVGVACRRALELYLTTCVYAPPEPRELASWLVDLDVDGPAPLDMDVNRFADVLGTEGLAAYRERVEELWAQLPPDSGRTPYLVDERTVRRMRLRHIREKLAARIDDVDAYVAVLAENIPDPAAYLRIAEALHGDGRASEAIAWAEEGVTAHPGLWTGNLADFLTSAYVAAGRGDDALALCLRELEQTPRRPAYEQLRALATELGRWDEVHGPALETLRAAAVHVPALGDQLVRLLLDERDTDGAWAAAHQYGCDDPTWFELAKSREHTNPADVVWVYERLATRRIERGGRDAYRQAAGYLAEMRAACGRRGEPEVFDSYVAELRGEHARKRALLEELDRHGLGS